MRASTQFETLFSPWEGHGKNMDQEFGESGYESVRTEIVRDGDAMELIFVPIRGGPYSARSLIRFDVDWREIDERIGNRRLILSRYILRDGQLAVALRFGRVLR